MQTLSAAVLVLLTGMTVGTWGTCTPDDQKKVLLIFNNRAMGAKANPLIKTNAFECDSTAKRARLRFDTNHVQYFSLAGVKAVAQGRDDPVDPDERRLHKLGTATNQSPAAKCPQTVMEEIDEHFDEYFTAFDVTGDQIKNCHMHATKAYFEVHANFDGDHQVLSAVYRPASGNLAGYFSFVGDFDMFDFIYGNDCGELFTAEQVVKDIADFDQGALLTAIIGESLTKEKVDPIKCHTYTKGRLFVVSVTIPNGSLDLYADWREKGGNPDNTNARAGDWLGFILVKYSPGDDYRLIL